MKDSFRFVREYDIYLLSRRNKIVISLMLEECRFLGCYAVALLYERTFRRKVAPPSSG
jgi:hypothetical protein